jgi:FdhE protein
VRAAGAAQPEPQLDLTAAQHSLAAGQPILTVQDLVFDRSRAAQLFTTLCRAAETAAPGRAEPLRALRRAVERRTLDLALLWPALAAGDQACLDQLAARAGLDRAWLRLLGQHSLLPGLRALAAGPARTLRLEGWQRGACPLCGSPPLLAEVQGKEGARRLRCGLCGLGWSYPRLQCVACRTTNHRHLGFLCLEGEGEKYRLQTCDLCHGYLKVVVTFEAIAIDMLAVEDLATLHLDSLAAECGFARAAVPV